MHARILKECRALVPMWGAAMLLVVAPLLVWPVTRDGGTVLVTAMFGFAWSVALLSVASFGKEFAQGTFSLLLTQPISRWRLWWEKTLVLGAALASVVLVFMGTALVSVLVRDPASGPFSDWSAGRFALIALLMAGAAYGGGLCLTLLLRQANGAFWLALVLPCAACLGVGWLAHKLWGEDVDMVWVIAVALAGYALFAYVLGLRLFLRNQDAAWLAGDVTFPLAPACLVNRTAPAQPGRRFGKLTALLNKELHLQQVSLLCAALFVLLFVASAVAKRSEIKVLEIALHELVLGIAVMIWVLMPFLVGAVTIAEERRLGILEWQQSLPVSRRRQFLAKLLPACLLSVALAAVLPWLLEALVYASTGESMTGIMERIRESAGWKGLVLGLWVTLGLPVLASILATTVGVFASSLVRNLLHALSLVFVLLVAAWGLVGVFLLAYEAPRIQPGPSGLLALIGLPALLLVLCWLAYRNYREAVPGARLWLKNLAVLGILCVCVFGTTAALYARAWEVFLPDPRISSVHVNGPAAPKVLSQLYPFFILLPDGTLWEWKSGAAFREQPEEIGPRGAWRDVASRVLQGKSHTIEAVALKPDGTLWSWLYFSSTNAPSTNSIFRRQTEPVQFGTDRDWKAIAGGGNYYLALKTDGSLWAWGKNDKGQLGDGTTMDREQPVRIGSDTNWAQFTAGWGATLAVKTDGTLWEWGGVQLVGSSPQPGPQEQPVCPSPRRVDQGTNWARVAVSFAGGGLAIQVDGSLWKWGDYGIGRPGVMPVIRGPTRVGNDSDWVEVNGFGNYKVGLKRDGSLWSARTQEMGYPVGIDSWKEPFSRRSSQKPWLAVGTLGSDSAIALAADGSLWIWGTLSEEESGVRLIPPSMRPRLVARLAEPSRLKDKEN
jgi:alpha-tubulin suppressor-like RCC1 family protein